jgi:flagellar biosynthesis protein FliR
VRTALHLAATFPLLLELPAHNAGAGVRLALPMVALLLMANVALDFIARVAPNLRTFDVGFAVLFAFGAVGLLSVSELAREIVSGLGESALSFERLIADLPAR